jgi:hypothetical protein
MLHQLKSHWHDFKRSPPGQRFQRVYEQQQKQPSRWAKPLMLIAAVVSLAIGVVLVFIPGPAVVFFALTAALLGAQSRWVARQLDAAETGGRKWLRKLRAKRAKRA